MGSVDSAGDVSDKLLVWPDSFVASNGSVSGSDESLADLKVTLLRT